MTAKPSRPRGQAQPDRDETRITLRLPRRLLDSVKERAKMRGIPYQRFIREALERTVAK